MSAPALRRHARPEFLMKDAYSFDLDKAGAIRSYNKMFVAYLHLRARG